MRDVWKVVRLLLVLAAGVAVFGIGVWWLADRICGRFCA